MKALLFLGKLTADCAYLLAIGLYALLTLLVLGRKAIDARRGSASEDPLEG